MLLAPDSLKGALSATQCCAAMQRGISRACSSIPVQVVSVPLADGGEGTIEALIAACGGEVFTQRVRDPLGRQTQANWARLPDGTAVIEMAQASGLPLIATHERDALRASTFGTGELILAALNKGCRQFLIGAGGSATTDGGSGALSALGARFLDACGQELPHGGAALRALATIDLTHFDHRVLECQIQVLCDVTNPLCGERGAARVYAPQKGATAQEIEVLESALSHFADISSTRCVDDKRNVDPRNVAGAGAAGGLAFGLMSYVNAQLVSGIDAVLEAAQFAQKLESADLVLTAEGSIDEQTLQGKTLAGVARVAQSAKNGDGVAVIAFGGRVVLSGEALAQIGIVSAFPLCDGPRTLEYSMSNANELLETSVERAMRLWLRAQF